MEETITISRSDLKELIAYDRIETAKLTLEMYDREKVQKSNMLFPKDIMRIRGLGYTASVDIIKKILNNKIPKDGKWKVSEYDYNNYIK